MVRLLKRLAMIPYNLTNHPLIKSAILPSLENTMSSPTNTMDVASYSPAHSQLNLGSAQTTQHLANSVLPLYYNLTPNDFTTFHVRNKTICALDETVGIALMFTLQRLGRYIVDAGHYRILDHIPSSPVNLHPAQFEELNLPRPSVLLLGEFHNRHNPLFFLTNMKDLQGMHASLQLVGREAMDWISTAKVRAAQIGPACSWNFEEQSTCPSIDRAIQAGVLTPILVKSDQNRSRLNNSITAGPIP